MHIPFLAVLLVLLTLGKPAAGADWVYEMLDNRCSPQSRKFVATTVRNRIESSVRCAEALVRPPAPVGDLSCLESLMQTQIDTFAEVGSLTDFFRRAFDGKFDPGGDLEKRICLFAQSRWNELTRPLDELHNQAGKGIITRQSSRPDDQRSGAEPDSIKQQGGGPAPIHPATTRRQQKSNPGGEARTDIEIVHDIWDLLYGENK